MLGLHCTTCAGATTTIRLLRLLKLARYWKGLDQVLTLLGIAFTSAFYLLLLVLLFMFVLGLLGLEVGEANLIRLMPPAPVSIYSSATMPSAPHPPRSQNFLPSQHLLSSSDDTQARAPHIPPLSPCSPPCTPVPPWPPISVHNFPRSFSTFHHTQLPLGLPMGALGCLKCAPTPAKLRHALDSLSSQPLAPPCSCLGTKAISAPSSRVPSRRAPRE